MRRRRLFGNPITEIRLGAKLARAGWTPTMTRCTHMENGKACRHRMYRNEHTGQRRCSLQLRHMVAAGEIS